MNYKTLGLVALLLATGCSHVQSKKPAHAELLESVPRQIPIEYFRCKKPTKTELVYTMDASLVRIKRTYCGREVTEERHYKDGSGRISEETSDIGISYLK